jgi:hypothetical protein
LTRLSTTLRPIVNVSLSSESRRRKANDGNRYFVVLQAVMLQAVVLQAVSNLRVSSTLSIWKECNQPKGVPRLKGQGPLQALTLLDSARVIGATGSKTQKCRSLWNYHLRKQ